MATMLKKHINVLSWVLSLVLFATPKSNALPIKDVNNFCKDTFELDFCLKHIGSDKRIVAARDFNDVFLIAISESRIQVSNALKHINNVRKRYNGPLGKNRIAVCEGKYKIAADSFQKGWEVGQKRSKSLMDNNEMTRRNQAGFEALRECEDEWSKHGPRQASPLSSYYYNVLKLSQITRVSLSKLLQA